MRIEGETMNANTQLTQDYNDMRDRAEQAEAEVLRLRAALDEAGVALGNAACSLAEFENFEFNMGKALARAEQASRDAFDAISTGRGSS